MLKSIFLFWTVLSLSIVSLYLLGHSSRYHCVKINLVIADVTYSVQ